jgi:hypothetical protein
MPFFTIRGGGKTQLSDLRFYGFLPITERARATKRYQLELNFPPRKYVVSSMEKVSEPT